MAPASLIHLHPSRKNLLQASPCLCHVEDVSRLLEFSLGIQEQPPEPPELALPPLPLCLFHLSSAAPFSIPSSCFCPPPPPCLTHLCYLLPFLPWPPPFFCARFLPASSPSPSWLYPLDELPILLFRFPLLSWFSWSSDVN